MTRHVAWLARAYRSHSSRSEPLPGGRPTTYLVCSEDRGTPAKRQREFADRAQTVVELNAGHHPFLAQPEAVADLVLAA